MNNWSFDQISDWILEKAEKWLSVLVDFYSDEIAPGVSPLFFFITESVWPFLSWVFSDWANVVSALIYLQFLILLLMIVQMFVFRVTSHYRERYRAEKFKLWNAMIPEYLDGGIRVEAFGESLTRKDRFLFGEKMIPYLLDIEGDDKRRLITLFKALKYDRFLAGQFRKGNVWRRAFAVHFLGLMADQDAIPLIQERLDDRSEIVRGLAAEVLMRLKDVDSVERILEILSSSRQERQERISQVLLEFGSEILPELLRIFRKATLAPWVIVMVVRVFKYHVYLESTWDVLDLLVRSGDEDVRIAAIQALVEFEDPSLAELFVDHLGDENLVVRAMAAKGLGRVGGEQHIASLAELVVQEDFWVVKNAIDALVELGSPGMEALQMAFITGDLTLTAELLIREAIPAHQ